MVMRNLVAKIMVSLACVIIMLHAAVPHHHHDCCGAVGFVFENEVCCHCDEACHDKGCEHHREHHSHHPFDSCLLQEMLSQLTLSNADDRCYFTVLIQAEAQDFVFLFLTPGMGEEEVLLCGLPWAWPGEAVPVLGASYRGAVSLRAPPACV